MKCVVNWIPLRIRVRSRNAQPRLKDIFKLLSTQTEVSKLNLSAVTQEFGHFDPQHRFFVPKNCTIMVCFYALLQTRDSQNLRLTVSGFIVTLERTALLLLVKRWHLYFHSETVFMWTWVFKFHERTRIVGEIQFTMYFIEFIVVNETIRQE